MKTKKRIMRVIAAAMMVCLAMVQLAPGLTAHRLAVYAAETGISRR